VGETSRGYELRIAHEDIVVEPAGPIAKRVCKEFYRKWARKYGFGEDWYVLAAVGKVESNHGENMGPSGAGFCPRPGRPPGWTATVTGWPT
jgi:hypothetical protein